MLGLIMDKAIRLALAERKAQQTQVIDVKEVPQITDAQTRCPLNITYIVCLLLL